ncbi:MAG: right-handed parallel beta-helix repeat-containing protein [Candidatus Thermoplasmatota archaeon]
MRNKDSGRKKITTIGIAVIIIAFSSIITIIFFSEQVKPPSKIADYYTSNVTAPPSYNYPPPIVGDLIIENETYIKDKTIVLNGDLLIMSNGNLTLDNTTLVMNCSENGQYKISVTAGGWLYLYNSNITAYDITTKLYEGDKATTKDDICGLRYKFEVYGNMRIDESEISYLWRSVSEYKVGDKSYLFVGDEAGLRIFSSNVDISNSIFSESIGGKDIDCVSSSPIIRNCTLSGINCQDGASPTIRNNSLQLIRVSDSSPVIDRNRLMSISCRYSLPIITNNTVSGFGGRGGGISLYHCGATISHNTLVDCGGISCEFVLSKPYPRPHTVIPILINNCNLTSCDVGVYCWQNLGHTILSNSMISNCTRYGLLCREEGGAAVANTLFSHNKVAIGCWSTHQVTISNCTIIYSKEYDFWVGEDSHPRVFDTSFDESKVYFQDEKSTIILPDRTLQYIPQIPSQRDGSFAIPFNIAVTGGALAFVPISIFVILLIKRRKQRKGKQILDLGTKNILVRG